MKLSVSLVRFRVSHSCTMMAVSMCSSFLMIIAFGCSTEPAWQGKRLTAWLGEVHSLDQEKANAAEIALKQIGTNAIPYLIAKLTATDVSVAEWLKTGGRRELERTAAVLAFRILGSSATNALPALAVLLTNQTAATDAAMAYAVAQSMAGIGEAAKSHLVAALDNPSPNIRRAAMVGLIDLGKEARDVMPAVMERLKDGDAEVRGLALFFVSAVCDERDVKLRVFDEASQDPDRHVRSFAEKELHKMGGR